MTTGYGIFRSVSWLIKQHLVKSSLLSDVWGGFIGWKDSKRIGKIWHVEKGLFSSVGGMRRESGRPLCFDSRLYNARTIITVHSNIRFPRRKRFSHRFSHVQKRPNKLTIDSRRGEISTSATSQFQLGRRNRTIRVDSIHNDFEENREKIGSEREEGEKKGGKIDIFFRTRIKRKR